RVARERDDVLVIEGGVVKVPAGTEFNFNFGFPPGTAYACMAETMLLALEGRYECFSLGRDITVAQVDEISRIAEKHGFELAGLRSFERALTREQIRAVAERVGKTA
ncbi:MAG TPA: shikimate dehydrogenase, partial [Firmicutes bacterium]|nr:shikimate dehydrogenase [Bacillota bacterium]